MFILSVFIWDLQCKSHFNRKMVFRVTKSQSMKDKLSFIWYNMIILTGGCGGGGGVGGAIYMGFQAVWVQMSENTSTKEITKSCGKKIGWLPSKFFFFLLGKWSRGHILTNDTQRHTPGTPRKSGFSARKRPKEGERVTRRHFHERVGESPRREKNFGTSRSRKPRFVSDIWPFEVGICVRAD